MSPIQTETMTPEQLAAMVARARDALEGTTPGPWEYDAPAVWRENPRVSGPDGILVAEAGNATHDYGTFDANARLIASAPTLIADLADTIIAQAADIARLKMVADYDKRRADNLENVRDRLNAEIARMKEDNEGWRAAWDRNHEAQLIHVENHATASRERDAAEAKVAALTAENADLKSSVIAFGGPWAVEYAKQRGLPDGQLIPTHYDILKQAGARMDSFTRAALGDKL